MTITYGNGQIVLTIDDTVGINLPPTIDTPTKAINVTRLRADDPATERLAFGVLSPSGEQPLIGVDPDETAVIDELQLRFNRLGVEPPQPVGRHRAPRPGLFARLLRLFGFGRRGGA